MAQCVEKYGTTYNPTLSNNGIPAPAQSDSEESGEEEDEEPEDRPAMMATWTAWVVETQRWMAAQRQQLVGCCLRSDRSSPASVTASPCKSSDGVTLCLIQAATSLHAL